MVCTVIAAVPAMPMNVQAATFSQINSSAVFVKQQTNVTCTLAANVMLLRRTAMMRGDADWNTITEWNCRSTLWVEGAGMRHSYSYRNISVSYQYVQGNTRTALINALREHPEGIAVYDWNHPHAILLTDYTNGVFYCSDPWTSYPAARIPASQASISVDSVDAYWYVVTPDVVLNNSTSAGSVQATTIANLNETWKIHTPSGVNMRGGAGTYYSVVGYVPNNASVKVTKRTAAGGYTWGYASYKGKNGWIALDYAKKIASTTTNNASSALTNKSSISASQVEVGKLVTVKGAAAGGTGAYTYAYYCKKSDASSWTTIKPFSSSAYAEFKPLKEGTYDVCIKVKDSAGKLATVYKTVKAVYTLENKSSLSKTELQLGETFQLNGNAAGGTGSYQYAFYCRRTSSAGWSTLKDFSTVSSISYKPLKATQYEVCIKVKDVNNGKCEKKYFTVTVN